MFWPGFCDILLYQTKSCHCKLPFIRPLNMFLGCADVNSGIHYWNLFVKGLYLYLSPLYMVTSRKSKLCGELSHVNFDRVGSIVVLEKIVQALLGVWPDVQNVIYVSLTQDGVCWEVFE